MTRKLTNKQRAFVEAYLENGMNGTQAVYTAGYRVKNDDTAAVIAYENLRKPRILQAVEQRLRDMAMSADEVLYRLSKQAEGVDPTEFMTLEDIYAIDDSGKVYLSGYALNIALEEIKKRGLGSLIKRIGQTSSGISIEWYDAQAALVHLGRFHKLFTDKIEIDQPVTIVLDK